MYGYKKQVNMSCEQAVEKIRQELVNEGFGVLTQVDVGGTLRKKLGIEYGKYLIMGICNPSLAFRALQVEKDIGLMMPCNIIIYEQQETVSIACVLPTVLMGVTNNQELKQVAEHLEEKLKIVIDSV